MGNGDFVMNILSEANERMNLRYELKSLGYDLDKLEQRVLGLYQIERGNCTPRAARKSGPKQGVFSVTGRFENWE